ncbi:hypothetical protein QEO94_08170 [Kingella negevensis]|uniref:hypothetical protein n=1 Tax=Kingella negevensis TaxID=1522312 RepID=UPI0025429BA7|nr:hypothetical protein [Kingella negevensis]WII92612.1 hypothetical protein QEO94_08170 [Kingella negevensis]
MKYKGIFVANLMGAILLLLAAAMEYDAIQTACACQDVTCMGADYIPPISNIFGAILVYATWLAHCLIVDWKQKSFIKYWVMIYPIIITFILPI